MRPKNLEKEEAIRTVALQMIADEGLENLSMQRLAAAANVSPRTIYLKYADKEDLLIKLLIEEVIGRYEPAVMEGFSGDMPFEAGVRLMWDNIFHFYKNNRPGFVLMLYARSSPLLNKAFQQHNIQPGDHFKPVHVFLKKHAKAGLIHDLPIDIHRAMMLGPIMDLLTEYFDHLDRPKQIITEKVRKLCCDMVIKGMLK